VCLSEAIFLRKPGTDIYILQALARAVVKRKMDATQDFVFSLKKRTRRYLQTQKKIRSVNALKAIFYH